ncbi:Fic family protein [Pseudarthrobacter albicanus]|uniref:Fic family protein n=1 Tax=Pseudarthrobacter albicanus TaxID=2823873 RepID=UPI001FE9A0F7|nr:Fic family protein [Pseudarthrobacter albicanus]
MPWKASGGVPREDREFTEVTVSLPPMIAECWYHPGRESLVALEEAAVAVASLDVKAGSWMAAISGFLLRSESVSSSRIEHVEAKREDYARAMIGLKASADARSMAAATDANQTMIDDAGQTGAVRLEAMLTAHGILMKDDTLDSEFAGKIRDIQNWIGGSDYSPRGAIHVPPPPDLVPGLLEDLMAFSNRKDLPIMAQAAIAHAQFESIRASEAASESVSALDSLPAIWTEAARPRKGSADARIIPWLLERPVFEAHSAAHIAGVAESSVYGAWERPSHPGGTLRSHPAHL